jgi:pyruvate dehydrogenase E2 component (dihydrolipoamide acetyltransferase)
VPVGANLAIIGEAGEDVSGMTGDAPPPAKQVAEAEAVEAEKSADTPPAPAPTPSAHSAEFPGGVKATPVARRIAGERGIDLTRINGSGPGGRVRKADVTAFVESPAPAPAAAAAPAAAPVAATPPAPPVADGAATTEIPLTRLRKAIARRMTESTQTVPQFYVTTAIDMTDALALRKQLLAALPEDEKISVNDMIVKAAGLALAQFPNLNASYTPDALIRHNAVNVGSAVAVEGGLLTVTQRHTDRTPLRQVARDNRGLISRARSGKVQQDDIQGSTFSVSNLGAWSVDHFIAIVNPPEAAILAVGSAEATPVVRDGQIVVRQVMKATCSADHRVTDGAEVAQFLQLLKQILENPLRLLL